jgi:hypothetical protein
MSKALIVAPAPALQAALAAVPGIDPRFIIDGLGSIVEIPDALIAAVRGLPGVAVVATAAIADPRIVPSELQPWIRAWNKLFDPSYQNALATRPPEWLTVPAPCDRASSLVPPPAQIMTLTGDVAVGLIYVNGPGAAQLSLTDFADGGLALIQGFEILYNNAPREAKLVFLAETQIANISVDPASVPAPVADPRTATNADYETRESRWRDSALSALSLPTGFDGVNRYRSNLVARQWPGGSPTKSIVVFFTNYSTAHFAYAAFGRVVVRLSATRPVVGQDNLDRVAAHEICHLFDAPDEYGNCNPLQVFGPFHVLNGNCNNPLRTPCLMNGTSDSMCIFSKAHVGWSPLPPPPNP